MCHLFYLTLIDINMVEVRINHFAWSKSTQGVHAHTGLYNAKYCTNMYTKYKVLQHENTEYSVVVF